MTEPDPYNSGNVRRFSPKIEGNAPGAPLKGGGDDGTYGGMEARFVRIESEAKEARRDISDLRVAIATVTERISHLPSKGYIGSLVVGGVAVSIALLTLFSKLGWLVAGTPK